MSNGTKVIKLSFQAEYDSLTKLEKELSKIQNQSSELKLGKKELESIELLKTKITQLQQLAKDRGDEQLNLGLGDFENLLKTFDKIVQSTNNVTSALHKMVPPDAQEKIESLTKTITSLNEANKKLGREKGLEQKKLNKISANLPTGETDENGQARITTYTASDIKAKIDEFQTTNTMDPAIVQQYVDAWQELQPAYEAQKAVIDAITKQIEENRNKVVELNTEIKKISTEGVDSTPELPEQSKKAIKDFTSVVGEMQSTSMNAANAIDEVERQLKEEETATRRTSTGIQETITSTNNFTTATKKQTSAIISSNGNFSRAVKNVVSYGSALTLVRTIYTKLISTIKEMDQALTSMTVVTSLSREQAWGLTGDLAALAQQTGMTTTEVAKMTTMYLQQGKTLSDALTLTEAAAKAARIAGISGEESINLLTNAMNGFQLSADKAMQVSDKFAALAAGAATDYEELATALSKVAAQANLAGMSVDFTLGLLTKGIEVTREAPETIGTALKTVIARMRELTDYGETLEDGIDVNRVDKALKNIGVSLLDANREFRDLDDVLTEVGMKWDTLNKNQQANVAVALAGTRQQSRLIAMMQDFDRTQELVNLSMNSAGATAAQHRKYMQGLEAATTNLTTSYQKLITTFTNSDIAINTLNGISSALEFLSENIGVVYLAIGSFVTVIGAMTAAKIRDAAITNYQLVLDRQRAENERQFQISQLEAIHNLQNKTAAEREAAYQIQQNNILEQQKAIVQTQAAIATNAQAQQNIQASLTEKDLTKATLKLNIATLNKAKINAIAAGNAIKVAEIDAQLADANYQMLEIEREEAEQKLQLTNLQKEEVELNTTLQNQQMSLQQAQMAAAGIMSLMNLLQDSGNVSRGRAITQLLLQKIGLQENTAAIIAHNIALTASVIAEQTKILFSKKATKAEKEQARALIFTQLGLLLKSGANTMEAVTTESATQATNRFTQALYKIPIIGLILLIVSLITAIIQLASETESVKKFFESLKGTLSGIFDIIGRLLGIITNIIQSISRLLEFALAPVMSLLTAIFEIINIIVAIADGVIMAIEAITQALLNLVENIPGLGGFVSLLGGITDGLKNAGEFLKNWFAGWTGEMSRWFETSEQKSARLAEEIAKNQEKIYDNKNKTNTLQPLIDEYTELSNKANKSAEDLDRLKQIEDEIGQTDKNLLRSNGTVDIAKAKAEITKLNNETTNLINDNYNKAIEGVGTGYMKEEFKSSFVDYYTEEVLADSELTEIAGSITQSLQTALDNVDYSKIKNNTKASLDALKDGVVDFEKSLVDSSKSTSDKIEQFADTYKNLADGAKEAFTSVYTVYADYYSMLQNLDAKGQEKLKQAIDTLGLTDAEYTTLKETYVSNIQQGEDETDEAYAKRQEEAWKTYFSQIANVASGSNDRETRRNMILQLTSDPTLSQDMINAVSSALIDSNQMMLEDYTKKTSTLDNIEEASKKAAEGTLTLNEYRTLAEENPELFSDAKWVASFKQGAVDLFSARKEASEELKADLEDQRAFAQQQLDTNTNLTEEQRKNYQMQINLVDTQLENLKYAYLYETEIFKSLAKQTDEKRRQIRVDNELNKIQKEREKLNKNNEDYQQKRIDLLKEEMALNKAKNNEAQSFLYGDENQNTNYEQLQALGLELIDGEWVGDINKIKEKYGDNYTQNEEYNSLLKWADENKDNIKEAQEVIDEYEETQEEIFDEYRSIIEEEYEKEKEILEKRQETYEQYFDDMDALQDEQERAASREDILNQLSALSGGSDSASTGLRKELLQQLADLNKEEEDARKQAMRDDLTKSIEKHITSIDDKMDLLDNMSGEEILGILSSFGYDVNDYVVAYGENPSFPADMSHGVIKDKEGNIVRKFKRGGLVDFTGPAWVDGTKANPEAFLSANDTRLISRLVAALDYGSLTKVTTTGEDTTSVEIGSINIHTDHLDNNQDFRDAGNILAKEFEKAIRQRGINLNVKK